MIWKLIISDHMCMPDAKDPETGGQQEYKWSLQDRAYMLSVLARNSKTYIKFCGFFLMRRTSYLSGQTAIDGLLDKNGYVQAESHTLRALAG